MNTPTSRPNDDPELARWGLIALALVVGAFMMVYYVQLLHDSVARGSQWRYSQATGAPAGVAESAEAGAMRLVSTRR